MNKRTAKRLINELQNEVSPENVVRQFWMDKAQEYIRTIFGEADRSTALPMFATYYGDRYYNDLTQNHDEKAKFVTKKLIELFATYQEFIKNKVFFKRNILSDDNNSTLASIIVAIIVAVGTTAFCLGQYTTDVKNYELVKENKQLKIEISKFKNQPVAKPVGSKS